MYGLSNTRLYAIYSGMKQRCYNPKNEHYKWYGAKGITVCDEWMGDNGLQNFIDWAVSHGYNENLTIDRIDSSLGYSPDNCRWVTRELNSSYAANKWTGRLAVSEQLKILCVKLGISVSELGRISGKSPQAFSQKMKRESFTVDELKQIAEAAGCRYEGAFITPSGEKVTY